MKKNFYLILATMLLAVTGITLTACGDDNDEPGGLEAQLIGEWDDGPDPTGIDPYWDVFHLKFNSNHTGRFWVTELGGIPDDMDFTWSVKGDILTFKCNNPDFYELIFKTGRFYFSDGKLYLPDADDGDGLVLKRRH